MLCSSRLNLNVTLAGNFFIRKISNEEHKIMFTATVYSFQETNESSTYHLDWTFMPHYARLDLSR